MASDCNEEVKSEELKKEELNKAELKNEEVKQKINDLTECVLCSDTLKESRLLPCFHSFCLNCLKDYAKNKAADEDINCPICRKSFKQPVKGLKELPINHFIDKIIDITNLLDVGDENESQDILCDLCLTINSSVPATGYCVECCENLCEPCMQRHKSVKVCAFHKTFPLDQKPNVDELLKMSVSNCQEHPHQQTDFYCYDCRSTACVVCYVGEHKDHRCADLKKSSAEMKQRIDSGCEKFTTLVNETKEMFKSMETKEQELEMKIEEVRGNVKARYEELRMLLDTHYMTLDDNLNELESLQKKELQTIKENGEQEILVLESIERYWTEVREWGSACDIVQVGSSLEERLHELINNHQIQNRERKNKSCFEQFEFKLARAFRIDDVGSMLGTIFKVNSRSHQAPINVRDMPSQERNKYNSYEQFELNPASTVQVNGFGTSILGTMQVNSYGHQEQVNYNVMQSQQEPTNNSILQILQEPNNYHGMQSHQESINYYEMQSIQQPMNYHGMQNHQEPKNYHEMQNNQQPMNYNWMHSHQQPMNYHWMPNQERNQNSYIQQDRFKPSDANGNMMGNVPKVNSDNNPAQINQYEMQSQVRNKYNSREQDGFKPSGAFRADGTGSVMGNVIGSHGDGGPDVHPNSGHSDWTNLMPSYNTYGRLLVGGNLVTGLAIHNDELFVVRYSYPVIDVYSIKALLKKTRQIKVPNMNHAVCLVYSERDSCLYISNQANPCYIHKINPQQNENSPQAAGIQGWIVKEGEPFGLSITNRKMLLVSIRNNGLVLEYDSNGELGRSFVIKGIGDVSHALELSSGQLVICQQTSQSRIRLVDCSGTVLKTFDLAQAIFSPTALALDDLDNIMIIDHIRSQLIVLNSELQMLGKIAPRNDKVIKNVRCSCWDRKNNRLLVGSCRNELWYINAKV